ncbi:MAG: hypothetical protein QMC77_08560 [Methanocellales archaeon]|nr:hypothetical protein [Methanocellales archaeon]
MQFLIVHTRNEKARKNLYKIFVKKEVRELGARAHGSTMIARLSPNVWLLEGNGLALVHAYKEYLRGMKENGLPGITIYASSVVQPYDVPEKIKDICEWKIREENKYKNLPNKDELKNIRLEFKEITWKEKFKEESI